MVINVSSLGKEGLHGPLEGRTEYAFPLLGGNSYPGGQQLLVEPVGGRGGIGGAATLEPERQPARASPHPGHEKPAALVYQAALAEPWVTGYKYNLTFAGGCSPKCRLEHRKLCLPSYQRSSAGRPASPSRPRRTRLWALQVRSSQGVGPRRCSHLFGRAPIEDALCGGPSGRAHQHRTRPGHRLEGCGGTYHPSYGSVVGPGAAPDGAHYSFAGFDAHSQREPFASSSARHDPETCQYGPLRVVLVCFGGTEEPY